MTERVADVAELERVAAIASVPTIDLATIGRAVNDMIAAVAKQATYLRKAKYAPRKVTCPCGNRLELAYDATAVAKAAAHCAKVTDELSRLSEFAQGRADSRPGGAAQDVLAALSDAELAFVQAILRGDRAARAAVAGWQG
jgi:hypothetical protein